MKNWKEINFFIALLSFCLFVRDVKCKDTSRVMNLLFKDGHAEQITIIDDDPFNIRKRFTTIDPLNFRVVQDGAKGPFGFSMTHLKFSDSLKHSFNWATNFIPIDSKFFENSGRRPRLPHLDAELGFTYFFGNKESIRKKWLNFQNYNLTKVYRIKTKWKARSLTGVNFSAGYLQQCVHSADRTDDSLRFTNIYSSRMVYFALGLKHYSLQNLEYKGSTFVSGKAFVSKLLYILFPA